jgi:hypothetical protein
MEIASHEFLITQALFFIGISVKLYFDVQEMKSKIKAIEAERKQLIDKLQSMSETLAIIKSHFELGTLTKLKTHDEDYTHRSVGH